jgi:hypothetical protein
MTSDERTTNISTRGGGNPAYALAMGSHVKMTLSTLDNATATDAKRAAAYYVCYFCGVDRFSEGAERSNSGLLDSDNSICDTAAAMGDSLGNYSGGSHGSRKECK